MSHKTKTAKRMIAMLLSLVMLMGLLPMSVFAADRNSASVQQTAPGFAFGTEKTELKPGKYELPVALMKASNPAKPSMAAAAVKSGMLEVADNGDAFVTVELGPVKMMGLTGWSKDWAIYQEYNTSSQTVPAEVVSANEQGNVTAIRFQLPFTDQDGVYASMGITVVPMKPDGLLKLDFAKAKEIKPETPVFEFGPEKTPLEPGVYELPVSLMNASNPANPSMAGACVKGGSLEVMDNGDAFVNVKLGPVTMGSLVGWSSQWEIYNEYNTTSATTPAEVVAHDDQNHETEIRFQLPFTDKDGVYGKMLVDVMGMSPDAFLKLDFAQIGKPQPEPEKPEPEVKTGVADVAFSGDKAYEVTAEVSVLDGKIVDVKLSHNAAAAGHQSSASYADKAMAMADKFTDLSATDKAAIEAVDTVSGATTTSQSYKTAVLKALGLYQPPKPADFTFGSANTELKPGTYVLPVSLRNADKHENASVAMGAFAPNATLTVDEQGTATVVVEMQAVEMGPIRDMAYNVKIYQEDNYTSAAVDAEILESIKKPEGMTEPGKDVPTKISFVVPNHDWDGVYMNFKVDAMGGATPDGWLQLDYARAGVPGESEHHFGEAKVDQFGKYTIHTDVTVQDGVIADVAVTADSFISETHRPTNESKIKQVTEALKTTWNGMAPTQENAERIFKAIMKEDAPDDVIDSVSGATYSAKAVRDAVMDAFGLTYEDEVIHVPQSVEPGIYEVEIGYYSDVVWHSLVENVKSKATLTVNADQTMSLDFETKSGTAKEPLYILGFNGVYVDNDRQGQLTKEGCTAVMGLSSNDYEDQYFEKGTQVVNHLTFPLLGGLNKVYNTNCYLYVPAMNNLNGDLSGIHFENGKFNADVFAKIYWDTMQKVGEVPGGEDIPVPADGKYTADVVMNKDGADQPSMCDALFGGQVDVEVRDGKAVVKLYVAYPIPSFPEDGKDGTLKDFTVTYRGEQYVAASDITSKPTFVVKADNPMFGMVKGEKVPAQVLTVELPAAALTAEKLDVTAFVNSVMHSNVDFDLCLTNLTAAEPAGKIEDGRYYVNVALWNSSKDVPSMGDKAFQNNRKALVTVENGHVVAVQAASNPVQMGPIISAINAVTVEGKSVTILSSEQMTTKPENKVIDYIKTFCFDMPAQYQPEELTGIGYVPVQFMVPGTPMGDRMMDARLKLEWGSAVKTEDTALEGNSDIASDNVAIELIDEATGVKLNANSKQIPSNAKLSVTKPTSGVEYDAAAGAMAEEGVKDWKLFRIVARVGEDEVQPGSGSVAVSIPCTDKGLTVYRIDTYEDGTSSAVPVDGRVENGYYVFNTRKLGAFSIVGEVKGAPSVLDRFTDIPSNHWGRNYIEKAVELELMKGVSATAFAPDLAMNRAMFVTVLGNMAGVKSTDSGKTSFTDVPEDEWYAPYVAWAEQNHITAGTGAHTFSPDATITREEMAVFMVSYCKYAGITLESEKTVEFKDADTIRDFAKAAVKAVTEAGLLSHTGDGNFSPRASATRAQAATMLVNFVEKYQSN